MADSIMHLSSLEIISYSTIFGMAIILVCVMSYFAYVSVTTNEDDNPNSATAK